MNTELFKETLNRLKAQADTYRNGLLQYKNGLDVLHNNINKFNTELFNTRSEFEKLIGESSAELPVMKLYSFNEKVA